MRTYLVRVSLPRYYEVNAESAQEARAQAEAQFRKDTPTRQVPTVEVIMDDGVATGFWDVVDGQIDESKERGA